MSDISQIQVNGTTYDLCDATSRAEIASLQDSVDLFVNPVLIDEGSINNIFTPGIYHVTTPATDMPEGVNGILGTYNVLEYRRKQFYSRGGTAGSNDGNLYMREGGSDSQTGGSGGKFTGTKVS